MTQEVAIQYICIYINDIDVEDPVLTDDKDIINKSFNELLKHILKNNNPWTGKWERHRRNNN
jgi:hypothetical protein